jgi:glycopeptide antibiotics resistance protein
LFVEAFAPLACEEGMKSERLGQRVYLALAALFLLFIAYVSWAPVPEDAYLPDRGFFRGIERLPSLFFPHHFRDFATNILLYIPLGVFVASAVVPAKPRFFSRWTVVGFLASAVMEAGQSVFGRYPDALDIITNSVGFFVGYWIVVTAVRLFSLNPVSLIGFDAIDDRGARTQTIAVARFGYICVYVLLAMLPFDVSVIYYKIYAQLFPDASGHTALILDPLYHAYHWPQSGIGLMLETLLLIPVAVLSSLLNFVKGRSDVLTAVLPCVLVALFCEVTQVFVMSRTSDIAMFPLAVAAGILGWGLTGAAYGRRRLETLARHHPQRSLRWRWTAVALIAYGLVIAVLAVWPFEFEIDHRVVAQKIFDDRNVIPLRSPTGVPGALWSAVTFVPLGFLLMFLFNELAPDALREKMIALSGLLGAAYSTLVEFLQCICVGRFFDATAVLMALVGGALGAALSVSLHFGKGRARSK